MRQDVNDSGFVFANELHCQLHHYFAYVLNPKQKGFQGVFWAGCYLSPFHKGVLDQEKGSMSVVKKVLKGKGSSKSFLCQFNISVQNICLVMLLRLLKPLRRFSLRLKVFLA